MTIARIIESRSSEILTCDVSSTVSEAIAILGGRRISTITIIKDRAVVGIFSERDVIYKLRELGPSALDMPVQDAMTAPAVTVTRSTGALEALALMTKRRIRHLPVLEDGKMIAFVSIGDVVKYRIEQVESEAAAMRDYIQTA